eukprot:1906066-Rhodomonas_salina.1
MRRADSGCCAVCTVCVVCVVCAWSAQSAVCSAADARTPCVTMCAVCSDSGRVSVQFQRMCACCVHAVCKKRALPVYVQHIITACVWAVRSDCVCACVGAVCLMGGLFPPASLLP